MAPIDSPAAQAPANARPRRHLRAALTTLFAVGAAAVLVLLSWLILVQRPKDAPSALEQLEPLASSARASVDARGAGPQPPPLRSPPEQPRARPAEGTRVATFEWGTGPRALGRSRPEEANPEAPMSLAATGDALFVLDQVNGRLVRLSPKGDVLGSAPLTVQAAQDLAVSPDGRVAVLDRLVDKTVALHDAEGRLIGELPLVGRGLEEGGGVTGLFLVGEDVYVEREYGALLRVGALDGQADAERPSLPGRPTRDGRSFISAGLIDARAGRVWVTAIAQDTRAHRFTAELNFRAPLLHLLLLDSDARGVLYVAGVVEPALGEQAIALACLHGESGAVLGAKLLPENASPDEAFREMVALPQGGVLFLVRDEDRASLQRYDCP